ncbi:hypothetical protein [Nocardioides dongxiaopingii]|uniref:hypothetical protein n=1 Tax=Nocardioides dongxiaopingii TaxID=2576036 RepID=UPI0010C76ABD|nr:hypothetical protein [Nocardioides dongxiaopingii]
MGKWDPYSRRELHRLRVGYLRRNALLVAVVFAAVVLSMVITTWILLLLVSGAVRWYVMGAVHVGFVAAALHLVHVAHLAFDREAIWHVRGAWGEDNTRSELQRAKRRRLVWGWVDSITFQAGDLDHVVITRTGHLLAIDSKWRNDVTAAEREAMTKTAKRARLRAGGLASTIFTKEAGARHRARVRPLAAIQLVVIWGAAQRTVPKGGVEIDDIHFLAGRDLVPWLRSLEGESVGKDAAKDALERLRAFRAKARQAA